jgi:hypothetical protein
VLEKLKLSGNYVLKKLQNCGETKYYALNIKNGDCYEINETAYDILLMVQDKLSKNAIFEKLKTINENVIKDTFEEDYEELVKMSVELEILVRE